MCAMRFFHDGQPVTDLHIRVETSCYQQRAMGSIEVGFVLRAVEGANFVPSPLMRHVHLFCQAFTYDDGILLFRICLHGLWKPSLTLCRFIPTSAACQRSTNALLVHNVNVMLLHFLKSLLVRNVLPQPVRAVFDHRLHACRCASNAGLGSTV